MEREIINLTYDQHKTLCNEGYYELNETDSVEFEEIQDNYEGEGRHETYHSKVLKRISDNKFFKVSCIKDTMGWYECNSCSDHKVTEVFPEQVVTTIYK